VVNATRTSCPDSATHSFNLIQQSDFSDQQAPPIACSKSTLGTTPATKSGLNLATLEMRMSTKLENTYGVTILKPGSFKVKETLTFVGRFSL
jgi:hypothetical protein